MISSYSKEKNIMAIIDTNMIVTLHYMLRDGSNEGELIEDTHGGAPITFKFGVGQMIPGFEKHLKGKSSGENYAFLLEPGEAYGDANHKALVDIPLSNFANAEGKIDEKVIAVGQPVKMKNQNGQSFQGIIKEIDGDTVKVDFNHPMAGRTLHFSGEILDVKEEDGLS